MVGSCCPPPAASYGRWRGGLKSAAAKANPDWMDSQSPPKTTHLRRNEGLERFHPKWERSSGFSLIEAAIVLGVVGLVIGGIWVAAASVIENNRVNRTIEGLNMVVRTVQNSMTLEASNALGWNHMTCFVEKVGGFPKDWKQPNCGLYAIAPVGAQVHVYNGTQQFHIWIQNLSRSTCIKLGMKLSAYSFKTRRTPASSNLISIGTLYYSDSSTAPWTLQQVSGKCTDGSEIDLVFPYTRLR